MNGRMKFSQFLFLITVTSGRYFKGWFIIYERWKSAYTRVYRLEENVCVFSKYDKYVFLVGRIPVYIATFLHRFWMVNQYLNIVGCSTRFKKSIPNGIVRTDSFKSPRKSTSKNWYKQKQKISVRFRLGVTLSSRREEAARNAYCVTDVRL